MSSGSGSRKPKVAAVVDLDAEDEDDGVGRADGEGKQELPQRTKEELKELGLQMGKLLLDEGIECNRLSPSGLVSRVTLSLHNDTAGDMLVRWQPFQENEGCDLSFARGVVEGIVIEIPGMDEKRLHDASCCFAIIWPGLLLQFEAPSEEIRSGIVACFLSLLEDEQEDSTDNDQQFLRKLKETATLMQIEQDKLFEFSHLLQFKEGLIVLNTLAENMKTRNKARRFKNWARLVRQMNEPKMIEDKRRWKLHSVSSADVDLKAWYHSVFVDEVYRVRGVFWFREANLGTYMRSNRPVDNQLTPLEENALANVMCTPDTTYADVAAQSFLAQAILEPAEMALFQLLTSEGTKVIKHPRSGRPSKKPFRLSFVEGDVFLTWTGRQGPQGVDLKSVVEITTGLGTPVLKRTGAASKANRYMSLVTYDRTLDLHLDSEEERDLWSLLLYKLVQKEKGVLIGVHVPRPGPDAPALERLMYRTTLARRFNDAGSAPEMTPLQPPLPSPVKGDVAGSASGDAVNDGTSTVASADSGATGTDSAPSTLPPAPPDAGPRVSGDTEDLQIDVVESNRSAVARNLKAGSGPPSGKSTRSAREPTTPRSEASSTTTERSARRSTSGTPKHTRASSASSTPGSSARKSSTSGSARGDRRASNTPSAGSSSRTSARKSSTSAASASPVSAGQHRRTSGTPTSSPKGMSRSGSTGSTPTTSSASVDSGRRSSTGTVRHRSRPSSSGHATSPAAGSSPGSSSRRSTVSAAGEARRSGGGGGMVAAAAAARRRGTSSGITAAASQSSAGGKASSQETPVGYAVHVPPASAPGSHNSSSGGSGSSARRKHSSATAPPSSSTGVASSRKRTSATATTASSRTAGSTASGPAAPSSAAARSTVRRTSRQTGSAGVAAISASGTSSSSRTQRQTTSSRSRSAAS